MTQATGNRDEATRNRGPESGKQPSPIRNRSTWIDLLLLAVVVLAFSPALMTFAETWETVDYYAHGYLVGPVAAYMAWARRGAVVPGGSGPDGRGLLVLGGALLGYGAGLVGGVSFLQGVALPVAIAGLVQWRRGTAGLRRFALPIAYLIFMVPIPPLWIAPLVTRLQAFVTQAAISVLGILEVPALREGNVIVLPEGSLFVAEACSGITSVVTLLPVAALLAFLMPLRGGRAVGLLLAVVPVAMLWNLVRVLATVFATRSVGVVQATTGSLHDSAGMATFTLGCLSLLLLAAWIDRRAPATPAGG